MKAWPLALVLAACGGPTWSGVDLIVHVPDGIDTVEVLVAPDECKPDGVTIKTCDTAIGWDTSQTKLDGDVYILDVDTSTIATPIGNNTFRVDIAPRAPDDRYVRRMLFVGTGPNLTVTKALRDVTLPSTAERWELELSAVDDIPPGDPPPPRDGKRLHIWNRQGTSLSRCVVVERWTDGALSYRDFYVPPGDTDCDDVPAATECDAFYWRAPATNPPDTMATCATLTTLPAQTENSCLAGGAACSEIGATDGACVPVKPFHCAPTHACDPSCFSNYQACAESGALPSLHCRVATDDMNVPCTNINNFRVDLSPLVANTLTTCSLPTFGPAMINAQFTNPGKLGMLTITASDLPLVPPGSPCQSMLTFSGKANGGNLASGVAQIPLSNSTYVDVPLVLELFYGACQNTTGGFGCSLTSMDSSLNACSNVD